MKTPREILLGKHKGMEPRLNNLRELFVAEVAAQSGEKPHQQRPGLATANAFGWRDLLPFARWHLTGLTALWAIILTLHIAGGTDETPGSAEVKAAVPRTVILTLKENRRQILEFSGAGAVSPVPVVPTPSQSRRSQLKIDWAYS